MTTATRLRSVLFAPANRPDLIMKLPRSDPDAVVIDLEDGTPAGHREWARTRLVEHVDALLMSAPSLPVFVRVSTWDAAMLLLELEAVASSGATGLVAPKTETGEQVVGLERTVSIVESDLDRPALKFMIGLETAAGVHRATEIAVATRRVIAVYFGAEDFATDIGAIRTSEGLEVLYARSRVVISARLAGVAALDQVVLNPHDPNLFERDAQQGRALGYSGKLCIHPDQVSVARRLFSPSLEQLDRSRRLISAYRSATGEGRGTALFEGQMIDTPLVRRAEAIIATAGSDNVLQQ